MIPEIVCSDKQADWGRLWRCDWRTGFDEHSNPIHGALYRYLWSNGAKEGPEFADYSFGQQSGFPKVPCSTGFEDFSGRILHANDFHDGQEFERRDILIRGTSHPTEDIGSQCWK